MVIKNNRTYLSCFIFLLLLTLGCQEQKEVTITKDYVINPNWDTTNNTFQVVRMSLKDSIDSIKLKDVSPPELLKKLTKDTTFFYTANVKYNGEEYSERKVYFSRNNGFLWWGDLHKSRSTKKVLGELQQESWYLLTGLGKPKTLYYVYIDSLDSLHTFKVPASSWTNY